jgi:hypothetical protein
MQDDEERDTYPEREQHIFNEKVVREGGVFVEPEHQQRDCNTPGTECGPDDYAEDPYSIDNRPGTSDDANYSYGVELPNAGDLHLIPDRGVRRRGGNAAPDEESELDLGERDERDLWRRQRSLMEEDSEEGIELPQGLDDEDAERVIDGMGAEFTEEDVADTSATGYPTSGSEHGGFPERE